jgi:hypothetical protein
MDNFKGIASKQESDSIKFILIIIIIIDMEISRRGKIVKRKKIVGYFSLLLVSFLIAFVVWKRQYKMAEMEKWVTSNSWEWESGADVCTWSIISRYRIVNDQRELQYEIENLHIKFHTGETCTVIWAYGNTMIVRNDKKKYGFYERLQSSSRWHSIW